MIVLIGLIVILWLAFGYIRAWINQADAMRTVRNYVTYSSSENWNKAATFLTGGALISEQQNSKHNKGNPVAVIKDEVHIKTISTNFSIVDADVTEDPGNNRWNYRFYLEKTGNKWLIYKVELENPELPFSLYTLYNVSIPNKIDDVLNSYIIASAQGDWTKAQQYLTGEALIQVQQHPVKQVNIRGQVSNMELASMGVGDGYFVVKANYSVAYPNMKPLSVSVIITLTNNNGVWKIMQVDKS